MTTPPFALLDVPMPPANLEPADYPTWEWSWAYQGIVDNEVPHLLDLYGNTDQAGTLDAILANLTESDYVRCIRRVLVALDDDGQPRREASAVLGTCSVYPSLDDESGQEAGVWMMVRPDMRGQGLGTVLWAEIEASLAEEKLTNVSTSFNQSPEPEPGEGVITAPTGSGRFDTRTVASQIAIKHGFELGQVGRESRATGPFDLAALAALRDASAAKAGSDYKLHLWDADIPAEYREGVAARFTAQSTQAPTGEIDHAEENWDVARVDDYLKSTANAGERMLFQVVEHLPTGELVAINEMYALGEAPVSGGQGDMNVDPNHRGRGLGKWVLSAGMVQLLELFPTIERVYTWNAEENAHALAVSISCGFAPFAVEGLWQRKTGD